MVFVVFLRNVEKSNKNTILFSFLLEGDVKKNKQQNHDFIFFRSKNRTMLSFFIFFFFFLYKLRIDLMVVMNIWVDGSKLIQIEGVWSQWWWEHATQTKMHGKGVSQCYKGAVGAGPRGRACRSKVRSGVWHYSDNEWHTTLLWRYWNH